MASLEDLLRLWRNGDEIVVRTVSCDSDEGEYDN